MSRYINADELLKYLSVMYDRQNDEDEPFNCAVLAMSYHIKDAPTIEVPKWIPCSERLPNRQGYYICTCKDGSKYKRTTTVKWSNGWQLTGARAYWVVLAWMPLPEPWKGADDE